MRNVERLCLAHFWVAFAAFLVACFLGAWQMWVRSPWGANVGTPSQYFMSVTAHGVAMAYVLTTFFIMGFGYFVAVTVAASSASRQDLGVGRVLDGDRRRRDGAHPDPDGASLGALHLLSPAHRKPLVLYRACACRGGLLDLVRSHARRDARVETRKSREAGAVGDVRNGGKRRDVALDHRWRRGRTGVSGHPGIVGHRANHRCGIGAHAVLMDAACHRLLLAHPRIHRVLHDHPARGRRTALQRYDGPSHLHPVSGLQPSGRHASSDDGSRSTATAGSSFRCC